MFPLNSPSEAVPTPVWASQPPSAMLADPVRQEDQVLDRRPFFGGTCKPHAGSN